MAQVDRGQGRLQWHRLSEIKDACRGTD